MSRQPASTGPAGLYARAQADPEFLQRVRDAYTGLADVLDALWWREHPAKVSPSGTEAPQALVRRLQHLAYSAESDPATRTHATHRLNDAQQAMHADRAAIEQAISQADEPARDSGAPPATGVAGVGEIQVGTDQVGTDEYREIMRQEPGESPSNGPATPDAPLLDTTPTADHHPAEPRKRRLGGVAWITGGLVVALVVGFGLGSLLDSWFSGVPSGGASPGATGFTAVFDRTQNRDIDVPPIDLPDDFDPASSRELFHGQGSTVFAIKTVIGRVCAVAIPPELTMSASCVEPEDFPASGIFLSWTSIPDAPRQNAEWPDTHDWILIWQADGTVDTEMTSRARPVGPQGSPNEPLDIPSQTEDELARLLYGDPATFEGSVSVLVPEDSDGVDIQADCDGETGRESVVVEMFSATDEPVRLASDEVQCDIMTGLTVGYPDLAGTLVSVRLGGDLTKVAGAYVIVSNHRD